MGDFGVGWVEFNDAFFDAEWEEKERSGILYSDGFQGAYVAGGEL